MQLYYFLAIILSLCSGSLPESACSLPHAMAFSGMLIGTWWCLCLLAARIIAVAIERGEVPHEVGFELFDRQATYLRWLSLGLIVLCLGGFGLASHVDELPVVESSLTLQSLVLLLPACLAMLGLWLAEFAFAARLGAGETGTLALARFLTDMARGTVGWMVVPLLGLMAVFDIASLIHVPAWFPPWVGWALLATSLLCLAPVLVRLLLQSKPNSPDTTGWIKDLLAAAGERKTGLLVWDTGGRAHNAMIAGAWGRFRILVLSDRLVTDLTKAELSMVILHELAHVKRRHIPIRILSLLPAWLLGFAFERWATTQVFSPSLAAWGAILGSGLSIALTIVLIRWVSYRIEHDADRYATQLAIEVSLYCDAVPSTQEDAAMTLASALVRVTRHHESSRRATWLHPGIGERIRELGVTANPEGPVFS
ncbi:MAG: M48 family metalloprotease [Planctomycetota bacterium]